MIKARFVNTEGRAMFLWLSVERAMPIGFLAHVFEAPPEFPELVPGSRHTVATDRVVDWTYVQSGVMHGGYSLRIQRDLLPVEERASYDRYIGAESYAPLPKC